jgi:signal recognition particle receptor subunit beta
MKPNSSIFNCGKKFVRLTDYPGHSFYYRQLIDGLPRCLGMIFLIDSTDKLSFKKAAEELYDLMSIRQPKEILIFCNKQDLPFAKKILMIESELSTEM